jgi:hypothetical protein
MRLPWRRDRRKTEATDHDDVPQVVIGTEMAAARAEDASVRAANPELPSPLHVQYDFWAGETDLARFVPSSTDDEVRLLVHRFGDLGPDAQTRVRLSLTTDDLYTVLQFCRRAAVASLRGNDAALAADGLAAIGLVDVDRVDWRDVPGPLELAAHAVGKTGGDLSSQLLELRSKSVEKVGSMIGRLQDPSVEPSIESAGFARVATPNGVGLVDRWGGSSGSEELGPLLLRLADAVDADAYRTTSVQLSEGLPAVWFPKSNRERAEAIINEATAAGSVSARRKPGPDADAQQFTIFVLDAGSPELAEELRRLTKGSPGAAHAALALTDGSVFVLLIARSWVQGTDGIETTESLERFSGPFAAALRGDRS